jgi:hypothetical protein
MDGRTIETIEQFMSRALHDPVRGYYARNIRSIGARGDFTTAHTYRKPPPKPLQPGSREHFAKQKHVM